MFSISFSSKYMTLIAYYKGNLIADQLHVDTDNPLAYHRTLKVKLVVSKCQRIASAVSGETFSDEYNEVMIESILRGVIKNGGSLREYANRFYTDEDAKTKREEAFDGFGPFGQLIMTKTECMSIARHTRIGEVYPRVYKAGEYVGFGIGAPAFMMLARLNTPVKDITSIIARNDCLVSAQYNSIDHKSLKPLVVIRAKKGEI